MGSLMKSRTAKCGDVYLPTGLEWPTYAYVGRSRPHQGRYLYVRKEVSNVLLPF